MFGYICGSFIVSITVLFCVTFIWKVGHRDRRMANLFVLVFYGAISFCLIGSVEGRWNSAFFTFLGSLLSVVLFNEIFGWPQRTKPKPKRSPALSARAIGPEDDPNWPPYQP